MSNEGLFTKTGPLNRISYHLFDQGVQIVIPPRSLASVPEPIRMSFDGILHRSE